MKSTGEVMGVGASFPEAYYKAQLAENMALPEGGRVIISVRDQDKPMVPGIARLLMDTGFELVATSGTAQVIEDAGLPVTRVKR